MSPQEGTSKPGGTQGAPQPTESTGASQPDKPQVQSRASASQGVTQASGMATGGDEPPPSPPRNLNPFAQFTGTHRKRRRDSDSSSSDTSESNSGGSSPGRPSGPNGAAAQLFGATYNLGQGVPSSPSRNGQTSDNDVPPPSPGLSDASSVSSERRSSTPNPHLTPEEAHRQDEADRRTAELPTRLEEMRRRRNVNAIIAHTEDEEDGRDVFLIDVPNTQTWVGGSGMDVPMTLAQWERLLANAVIVNEDLFAQAQARLKRWWAESRTAALAQLRSLLPTVDNVAAQAVLGHRDVYLVITDTGLFLWVDGTGARVDASEWERLLRESHVFDEETVAEVRVILQQRSETQDRSANLENEGRESETNDSGTDSPAGSEESEPSSPALPPVRHQLTRAEQDLRTGEFRRRARADDIEVTIREARQHLEAAGWDLNVAFARFYDEQGTEEPPEDISHLPEEIRAILRGQGQGDREQPIAEDDDETAPQLDEVIYASVEVEGGTLHLRDRVDDGTYWVWASDGATAEIATGRWEALLDEATIYDEDAVEQVYEIMHDNLVAAREDFVTLLTNGGHAVPAQDMMDYILHQGNLDGQSAYDRFLEIKQEHEQAATAAPGPVENPISNPAGDAEPISEGITREDTPTEIKSEPASDIMPEPPSDGIPEPLSDIVPEPASDIVPEPPSDSIPEPPSDIMPEPANDSMPEPPSDIVPEPPSSPEPRVDQGRPEEGSPEAEEDVEEPEPNRAIKRRKLNDGTPRRPHTRSKGPASGSVHHMNLRPRRQAAPPPPPVARPAAPARRVRGGGRARALGTGTRSGSGAGAATPTPRATRRGNPTTTKGKPRSKNGVRKTTKATKKKKTTTTHPRRTPAQTQAPGPGPGPAPAQYRTRAQTRSQTLAAREQATTTAPPAPTTQPTLATQPVPPTPSAHTIQPATTTGAAAASASVSSPHQAGCESETDVDDGL